MKMEGSAGSGSGSGGSAVQGPLQLHVTFFTKQSQFAIPDVPYAVDANITNEQLNKLVKAVLRESRLDDHRRELGKITFDFSVCRELLREPLADHLNKRNVTTEQNVEVEYFERIPAPKPLDCLTHDDWVASVSCEGNWILTGCYDNGIHIWTTKGEHLLAIPGHTSPVKAVSWVSVNKNSAIFVSGSHDQTAMMWEWNISSNVAECLTVFKGHDKSVECIDVAGDRKTVATGSWDNSIKIWNSDRDPSEQNTNKKAKVEQVKSAKVTLNAHREAVSGVKWIDGAEALASCSWDHTLRMWDVELQAPSRNISAHKAFFSFDFSKQNGSFLTASADRTIRIFDPRSNLDAPSINVKGHNGWVSSVKWAPDEADYFISGGHDMFLKMWDIRSPAVPLFELSGHSDKILCCEWNNSLIMSGGADNSLYVYKAKIPNKV